MEERLEVAIVGAGPAGLSAAVNAAARGKTVKVYSLKGNNLQKAERVDNYLGFYNVSGGRLMEEYQRHRKKMGIEICYGKVSNLLKLDNLFIMNFAGEIVEAKTVILATGISKGKTIEGEEEFLGRGVSYCATCDGMLYRGKKAIVWGLTQDAVLEANFLAKIGVEVQYVSMRDKEELLDENIVHIKGQVSKITGKGNVRYVVVNKKRIPVDAIFILRDSIAPDKLMSELRTESGYIEVNRKMETNVPGLYAAGDCIGKPLQIAKAVSDGLIAAQQAARYLDKKRED